MLKWILAALVMTVVAAAMPANAIGDRNTTRPTRVEVVGPVQIDDPASALEVACGPNDENRTSDLCAQWKAADAARDAANSSKRTEVVTILALALGTILNGAALVGLIYTYRETKRSADAAHVSATAAIKAAEASGDLIRAERAWVTTKIPTCKWGVSRDAAGNIYDGSASLFITWMNTGRTPALNFRVIATCVMLPNEEIFAPWDLDHVVNVGSALGPGHDLVSPFTDMSFENLKAMLAGTMRLYVGARATYFDIYSPHEERETELWIELMIPEDHRKDAGGEMGGQPIVSKLS